MEPRTVAIILLITGVECSLLFFAASVVRRKKSILGCSPTLIWGAGSSIYTFGGLALLTQGATSPWFGIMFANSAILMGQLLILVGIRRLAGLDLALVRYGLSWVVYSLASGIFTFLLASASARIIMFSIVFSTIYIEAVILILGSKFHGQEPLTHMIAVTFGVLAACFLLRAGLSFFLPAFSVFSVSALNVATFTVSQAGLVAWSLGLILLQGRMIEMKLERALEEKSILFQELRHRFKNNIAVIAGLVTLESSRSQDERTTAGLENLNCRIAAIATLYDQLFLSGQTESVKLDGYLKTIAESLYAGSAAEDRGIRMGISLESAEIDAKRAVSLGIIVNELLTNAFKYAFPGGRHGIVKLSLRRDDGDLLLEIRDDGVGMPEEAQTADSTGLGLILIEMLTEQVGGSLLTSSEGGARFIVRFPYLAKHKNKAGI